MSEDNAQSRAGDADSGAPDDGDDAQPITMTRHLPGRVSVAVLTLLTAAFEIGSALIVLPYSVKSEHMAGPVYLLAYLLSLFVLWIYHMAFLLSMGILRGVALVAKVSFSALLVWVLWDLSRPYPVWFDGDIVQTGHSMTLKLAATLVALALATLISHAAWFGRGERVRTYRTHSWKSRLFGEEASPEEVAAEAAAAEEAPPEEMSPPPKPSTPSG